MTSPLPFSDLDSLITYACYVYWGLGLEGKAAMEQIVYDLNIKDLTQLRPDQYDAFYKAVEALKGKE